MLKQQNKNY